MKLTRSTLLFALLLFGEPASAAQLMYGRDVGTSNQYPVYTNPWGVTAASESSTCAGFSAVGSNVVKAGPGWVAKVVIVSGTAVTVKVYDNVTNSGTVVLPVTTGYTPSATAPPAVLPIGAVTTTGIDVELGGTTPVVMVCYR